MSSDMKEDFGSLSGNRLTPASSRPRSPQLDNRPALPKGVRGQSCALCQRRKVRCDRKRPCSTCLAKKVECLLMPAKPAKRQRRKISERELFERLRLCEWLLEKNGIAPPTPGAEDDVRSDIEGSSKAPSEAGVLEREYGQQLAGSSVAISATMIKSLRSVERYTHSTQVSALSSVKRISQQS
jgi:Fungal Zn(2)-Cys(6) binuclear cluster domain